MAKPPSILSNWTVSKATTPNLSQKSSSRTHGTSQPIGKLYGFDFIENRFFVRGEGNILYNFNGGRLTKDPNIAAQMLLRTFETIPPLLEKYQKEVEQISKDIPSFRK